LSLPEHSAATPKALSIGDRVERAIEDHADAEREIERGEAEARPTRAVARTVFWLVVTAISLYVVAPSLIDVLGSWRDLSQLALGWFPAMAALQGAALACMWVLQRTALKAAAWPDVIDSQLAGNALAKVAPGGGALGSALQYRMLVQAGIGRGRAVAALTASNLLTFAIVLALPILVVPAIIRGAVERSLVEATLIGLVAFTILLAVGVVVLALDSPLTWIGRIVQRARNRLRPHAPPLTRLPERLMRERDRLLATLGPRWKRALLAAAGRWAFDYATLLAALAAVGSHPRPALVLLAFCAAQVLGQIPITPGGLGFVEAGLTATLALAGVKAGDALLATFVYRLFSYWLALPLGLAGAIFHRRRYRRAAPAS
jgi:uncharacterized protein (TIRG00374 family)